MDISNYEIEIMRHAFERAIQRKVTPDMIEATILGGSIKRFGKHNAKFFRKYKKFTVICVCEITGLKIKVLTIETR
jgi:hypothetical protein|tara:strand:- start:646 stop:873 length:228 start_codon:yes stop_codon:yes gene_type:complete